MRMRGFDAADKEEQRNSPEQLKARAAELEYIADAIEEVEQFGIPPPKKKKKGKASRHLAKLCVRATEGEAQPNVPLRQLEDSAAESLEPPEALEPFASHLVSDATEQEASGVSHPDSGRQQLGPASGKTGSWGKSEQGFRIGEVVWGREKGWPPWPALVVSAQDADLWKGIKGVLMDF